MKSIVELHQRLNPDWRPWAKAAVWLQLVIACAWALTQFWYTLTNGISPVPMRVITLTAALLTMFLMFPATRRSGGARWSLWLNVVLMAAALASGAYMVSQYSTMVWRMGIPDHADLLFGAIEILLVLEAARRSMGPPLVGIVGVFILYALFGGIIPGMLGHAPIDVSRLIGEVYLTTSGLWGVLLAVVATYVGIFTLFGNFLNQVGAGSWFISIAQSLVGWARGGPAKIAVFASALSGSIIGNSSANVVTVGTFTIPLMKKIGYKADMAGAVEACASTGGQIMPPVMGASAFIIAEVLGIPFSDVVIAAAIPAALYFASLLMLSDFEARRLDLRGTPRSELPPFGRAFRTGWWNVIPIATLIVLLFAVRVDAAFAGLGGLVAGVVVGIVNRRDRLTLDRALSALIGFARGLVEVAIACAAGGVLVAVVDLTGLGFKFSQAILNVSGHNLLLTMVLTAAAAIVLGMGMPTTAVFIVLSVLIAPALINLHVIPVAAQLFVFFFGAYSAVTPPVAVAAYAAAPIAEASAAAVGVRAFRLALPSFVIPFMFVLHPGLLFHAQSAAAMVGGIAETLLAMLAMMGVTSGVFLTRRALPWERLALLVAAAVLVVGTPWLLAAGLALLLLVGGVQMSRLRPSARSAVTP